MAIDNITISDMLKNSEIADETELDELIKAGKLSYGGKINYVQAADGDILKAVNCIYDLETYNKKDSDTYFRSIGYAKEIIATGVKVDGKRSVPKELLMIQI